MRLIEETTMKSYDNSKNTVALFATICVDGYKFVMNVQMGTSMVQFYEERDGKSFPAKC